MKPENIQFNRYPAIEPIPTGHILVYSILRYIWEHYTEPGLRYSTIAQQTGCPAWLLNRIFQRETGFRIQEYIYQYRLSRLKEQYRLNPQKPLYQLALESGFPSYSCFVHHLHRRTGLEPKKFKEIALMQSANMESG